MKEKYGKKIASVVHLAAYYTFKGGNWEKYEQITIGGTRNLLEALSNFEVEQFLFSSTLLVYAPVAVGEKIREDSLVDPKWEYPLSKVKTEELIQNRTLPASSVIVRIARVYDDGCHSIPLSQQMKRIYEKKLESHFFPGNLKHGASFLHMEDLVSAVKKIVEKRKNLPRDELFVLGEKTVLSYGELQEEMGRLLHGKKWATFAIPKMMAKIGAQLQRLIPGSDVFIQPWMIDLADDHYDVDPKKAEEILGWEPVHKLKNCLPNMVEQLLKDPKKWLKEHHF